MRQQELAFQSSLRQYLLTTALYAGADLERNYQIARTLLQATHLTDKEVLDALGRDVEGIQALFHMSIQASLEPECPSEPDALW